MICGASNQDLEAIEDLCGLYALAGVHCIDGAADQAVVAAIRRGVAWALERGAARPWLRLSLSDGDDPHFRKAWFDPSRCPSSCPRPCERVCPAAAIGERDPGAHAVRAPAVFAVVAEQARVELGVRSRADRAGAPGGKRQQLAYVRGW